MHMVPTHHPYTNVCTHTYEMLCIHMRTHTYKVILTQTYTYVLCVHMYAQPTHNRTPIIRWHDITMARTPHTQGIIAKSCTPKHFGHFSIQFWSAISGAVSGKVAGI